MTRPIGISVPHRRVKVEEDDDIQVYKKPWVDLTPEEIDDIIADAIDPMDALIQTRDKLKEKNI